MQTRSMNTIKNNTSIFRSFYINGWRFDVRNLSFRNNKFLFIVTSCNIKDNIINSTKIAPVAELTYTESQGLRFTCKPSVNYPCLEKLETTILSAVQESIGMVFLNND